MAPRPGRKQKESLFAGVIYSGLQIESDHPQSEFEMSERSPGATQKGVNEYADGEGNDFQKSDQLQRESAFSVQTERDRTIRVGLNIRKQHETNFSQ